MISTLVDWLGIGMVYIHIAQRQRQTTQCMHKDYIIYINVQQQRRNIFLVGCFFFVLSFCFFFCVPKQNEQYLEFICFNKIVIGIHNMYEYEYVLHKSLCVCV